VVAPAKGDNPDGGTLEDGWKLMKVPLRSPVKL
jgi:hypothetical protein